MRAHIWSVVAVALTLACLVGAAASPAAATRATSVSRGIIAGDVGAVDESHPSLLSVVAFTTSGDYVKQAAVAADGRYALEHLPVGDYTICVDATEANGVSVGGYQSQCYATRPWTGRFSDLPTATTAVRVRADTTTAVDATLARGSAIAGTVTAAADGAPLSEVSVQISRPDGSIVADSETSVDGSYRIVGLAPSRPGYVLCFDGVFTVDPPSAEGYRRECYDDVPWDGVGVPQGVTRVVARAGAVARANAALASAGGISGQLDSDATGQGVSGVGIDVLDAAGNRVGSDSTRGFGSFDVRGLVPDAHGYTVCFDASGTGGGDQGTGYLSECYDDVPWRASSPPHGTTKVAVAAGDTSTVDAGLASAAAIAGTVTDAHGHPVADVRVRVEQPSGAFVAGSWTDRTGSYAVRALAASNGYVVCFDATQADGPSPTGYASQCYRRVPWDGRADVPSGITPVSATDGATHGGINAFLRVRTS